MSLGAAVGRDALIPPDPRGGANACGRDESRPYGPGKPRNQPQTPRHRTHVGADSISDRLAAAQGLVGGMPAAHPKPIQKLYAPLTVPPAGRLVFWAPGCYNYTVG